MSANSNEPKIKQDEAPVVEPEKSLADQASIIESKENVKPVTQEAVVNDMQTDTDTSGSAKDINLNEGGTINNDAVVQFASPAAMQAVNDLIDENEPDRKTSKWVLFIVVLVLLILALGAGVVYYFTQFSSSQPVLVSPLPDENQMLPSPTPALDADLIELQQVEQSDDVDSIKKDVNNTNLESLGNELNEIEGSL